MKVRAMLAFTVALLTMPTHCEEDTEPQPPEPVHAEGEEPLEAYEDIPPMHENPVTAKHLRGLHAKLDSDGDGKVSLKEILAHPEAMAKAAATKYAGQAFQDMDKSGDGKVSLEEHLADQLPADMGDIEPEYKKEMEQMKSVEVAKFKAADADGDQFLNITEVVGLLYPHTHDGVLHVTASEQLRQKDANSDGTLTEREFWDPAPLEDGQAGILTDDEHQDFEKLDRNGDGTLDLEEIKVWESGQYHTQQAMRKFFEMADRNNDMHISSEEMAATHDKVEDSDAMPYLSEWVDHYEL